MSKDIDNRNDVKRNPPEQIDLIELFKAILKRWYVVLICTVIGAGAMFGYVSDSKVTPLYKSSSMIFVANAGTITSIADIQIGSSLTGDFVVIAKSKPVIDTTIQTVNKMDGVNLTRDEVINAISVSEVKDTHIIKFTVTHEDSKIACDLCNALTDSMAEQIAYIMSTDKPTIVERAEISHHQINKVNRDRKVLIGGLTGFALAVAALSILFILDDKVKSSDDVEKYVGVPVLVSIPYDKAQTYKSRKTHRSPSKPSEN